MRETIYMAPILGTTGLTTTPCAGRYWHMQQEHGILEDYQPPSPSAELMGPLSG